MTNEYILCAAIKFNYTILMGRCHSDCMTNATYIWNDPNMKIFQSQQGFFTSNDRFVGRKEAAEIAYLNGQTKELFEELHSGDFSPLLHLVMLNDEQKKKAIIELDKYYGKHKNA